MARKFSTGVQRISSPLYLRPNLLKGSINVKTSEYKNYDDLPLFLTAAVVATALGVAPSSAYELMRVVASFVSFAPPQAAGLIHSAASPLPPKPKGGFAGTPFDFPVLKVGNRIVVPKEKFIQWVEQHAKGGENG